MAMASNLFASEMVLILTAAVLLYVARNDLRHYKIRNELIFVLAGLFFIHALVSGRFHEHANRLELVITGEDHRLGPPDPF